MQGQIQNIKICGISTAVPDNVVSNLDYINNIDNKRVRRQIKLTGIDSRRVSIGEQKASDLATIAADDLIKHLNWNKNEIDVLIFVTQSEDIQRPSTAFIIQNRLGIGNQCLVYDINHGCSGFIVGLTAICSMLQMTKGKGLLLVGESNAVEQVTHTNGLLEGDAAAATALEFCEDANPISYSTFCDGSRMDLLYKKFDQRAYMDGNAILLFGLGEVSVGIKEFMTRNNVSDEEIDYYVFHQAQKMIVDGIANELEIDETKMLMSCQDFGNTSSASIPLTICYGKQNGKINGKQKLLLCGFGIGLSWGIMYLELDSDVVRPMIITNEAYGDIKSLTREA